jgi:hypothetical protein
MVFFQAALLAGYAYAHATTWLGVRGQRILHAALVLLPLLVLPFAVSPSAAQSLPSSGNPTTWLFGLLIGVVGFPFFVISTSAPVLQRWFAVSGHPMAADPYFLYGASNLGSVLALVAYPVVIEPSLRLGQQSMAWAAGYGLFAALTLSCSLLIRNRHAQARDESPDLDAVSGGTALRRGEVLHWMVLAFIPSSLLLGVTSYLTTDIAAVPFLWVIPLAIYLLTFILVFARRPPFPHSLMVRAYPVVAVVLSLALTLSPVTRAVFIPLHLATFFVAAMVCHGELVRQRPTTEHLTAFYLAMSCGGVLGGLFNALIAPLVFDRVAEYPLALVLACLALPKPASQSTSLRGTLLDCILPLCLGAAVWSLIVLALPLGGPQLHDLCAKVIFGLAGLICYSFKDRSVRLALGIGVILSLGGILATRSDRTLYQGRNYFGVLRVSETVEGNHHWLVHGHIVHGEQAMDPQRRGEPLTYYHRSGPIGQVFSALGSRITGAGVAVVGLGAGTLACYSRPGERWAFYEIDPAVEKIARDRRFFTYFEDCRAAATDVILGDARLRLKDAGEHVYGLIVLDAFSSDAIPVHLLTREALQLYLSKLAANGVIAFHISNSFVDLGPVLGTLARDAGLKCLVRSDLDVSLEDAQHGKQPSVWGVMARRDEDLGDLENDSRWQPASALGAVWTDDYSNIVAHLRFKGR